jgi:hypothetical protein
MCAPRTYYSIITIPWVGLHLAHPNLPTLPNIFLATQQKVRLILSRPHLEIRSDLYAFTWILTRKPSLGSHPEDAPRHCGMGHNSRGLHCLQRNQICNYWIQCTVRMDESFCIFNPSILARYATEAENSVIFDAINESIKSQG